NASGSAAIYSTYLGGGRDEVAVGIAVDSAGSAYVTGATTSSSFPTVNPLKATLGGLDDGFVAKLNAAGNALVYATYLGGKDDDTAFSVTVDAAGSAYVTGDTFSKDFPTVNPTQPSLNGGSDAFVAKLNAAGSKLVYSSYLGGGADDQGVGIKVDAGGN